MKTTLFLLTLAAALAGCAAPLRPLETPAALPAPTARAAMPRDTSGERYEEEQKRLVSEWEWYAGGGN